MQELTDAYFEFEEEKARWASLEDNHDGECQRLGQEITKLHNQLEQVDYPDLFCIGNLCLPCSSADNICHEILTQFFDLYQLQQSYEDEVAAKNCVLEQVMKLEQALEDTAVKSFNNEKQV